MERLVFQFEESLRHDEVFARASATLRNGRFFAHRRTIDAAQQSTKVLGKMPTGSGRVSVVVLDHPAELASASDGLLGCVLEPPGNAMQAARRDGVGAETDREQPAATLNPRFSKSRTERSKALMFSNKR